MQAVSRWQTPCAGHRHALGDRDTLDHQRKDVDHLGLSEIWLSILTRKLLRRSSFVSIDDLTARVLAFIDYYNRTMAKPFKWTYQGKALAD